MLSDEDCKGILDSVAFLVEFGGEVVVFTGSVEKVCPLEFLVEERLEGLDVVGNLAEKWADGVVAFDLWGNAGLEPVAGGDSWSDDFFHFGGFHRALDLTVRGRFT